MLALGGFRQRLVQAAEDRLYEPRARAASAAHSIAAATSQHIVSRRHRIGALGGRLNALSPLAVLDRGYSLTKRVSDGELIRDAATVAVGDQLSTLLARGSILSEVRSIETDDE